MMFDDWAKSNLGKYIDYDKIYGVQCVDLIKHYIKNVLGVTPQSIGNAIEYYNYRKISGYLIKNFIWYDNSPSFIPKKGDICVFTSRSGNGHVSVATGEGTTSYFYSYDQNYPSGKGEPMTKIKHNYKSFLGVLRPRNQKNVNPRIKKTTTANLNAYSTKKYGKPNRVIPKGSVVEIVADNEGKMTKNGITYNMDLIRFNTYLYYVASDFLKWSCLLLINIAFYDRII